MQKSSIDNHGEHNVMLHEFAYQLDSSADKDDSSKILHCRLYFNAWARTLQKDYENLRRDVADNQPNLLNSHGATNPAEFFVVATGSF